VRRLGGERRVPPLASPAARSHRLRPLALRFALGPRRQPAPPLARSAARERPAAAPGPDIAAGLRRGSRRLRARRRLEGEASPRRARALSRPRAAPPARRL